MQTAQVTPPAPVSASVPNHDGSPQDGTRALIGHPSPAIGLPLSVSSTLTMQAAMAFRPAPPFAPGFGLPAAFAILGGLVGTGIGAALFETFKRELREALAGTLNKGQRQLLIILLAAVPLAILAAIVGRILAAKQAADKNKYATTLAECSFVGTEGVAVGERTRVGDTLTAVRFEEISHISVERKATELTTVRSYATEVSHHDSVGVCFMRADGKLALRIGASVMREAGALHDHETRERMRTAFANAAENAYNRFALPRMLAALDQQGSLRFGAVGTDGIEVRRGRIDVAKGGHWASFAPSDVRRVSVSQGMLTLETATTGPIVFAMRELHNAKLLLAILSAIGVQM